MNKDRSGDVLEEFIRAYCALAIPMIQVVEGRIFHRISYEEFRTVEWKEVGEMDGMCDPIDARRQYCTGEEQARERQLSKDYMRERHGLKENKKPDYKPVKAYKGKKY